MEEFVDIEGFEGLYLISNQGRVYSLIRNKIMKPNKTGSTYKSNPYLQISLTKNCKRRNFLIHRLVSQHFCNDYSSDLVINHINGNKSDNNYKNLECCTQRENLNHVNNSNRPMPNNAKYVLNTETGIYYESIHKAAISKSIRYKTLMQMLSRNNIYKSLIKV